MTETNRRKLLKSVTVGTGAVVAGKALPDAWTRPIVDSVMLPAHAKATDDSGTLPPENTTTTTMAPCVIEGDYCWIEGSNAQTKIAVTSDGDITITRNIFEPANTWVGTGTASNGVMGGAFSIRAVHTSNVENVRDYTGTVVCNSTSIEGTANNPNNNTPAADYEATQAACSSVPG